MLNKRMAIKVKLQPGYATRSVQKVSESEEMLQAVLDKIGPHEAEVIQSIGETSVTINCCLYMQVLEC